MSDYILHYGVKGMKWGVRRYQNKDGSYTKAGKRRFKRKAKGILKGFEIPEAEAKIRRYDKTWKRYEAEVEKETKKANKALAKKDYERFNKHFEKSVEYGKRMLEYSKAATETEKYSKWLQMKLNEIENDKLVAGKDYVSHMKTGFGSIDYSINFLSGNEPYSKIENRVVAH